MKIQRKPCAIVASVLLIFILAVAGCSSNRSNPNASANILNVNNSSEPGSLHPAKAQGTHESWPLRHLFVGLTMIDPNGKTVPGAAKNWDISSDRKTYIFHLREGQKWSNGDPVTAQDFEFAWKHVLNPATASAYAYQLYYIEGAQAYNESREKDVVKLEALADKVAVKALDEKTLKVRLVNPTVYFDQLVSFYTYYPVDKNVQESNPKWANDAATFVSNGPFKLTEWKHKRDLKMMKNENYFEKDKIKLTGINWAMVEGENTAWQMYRAGKLDLAFPLPGDVVGQLKSQKAKDFKIEPEFSTYFYRFNTTKKPFTNAKIRTALALVIDRTTITEHIAQGGQKPAYALVAEGARDANGREDFRTVGGACFTENVEQAKRLLAEGLREEGLTSMPKFNIMYNTLDLHKRIAEAIAGMWKQNLGIDVGLENTEFKVKIDREHKLDYSVSRSGWVADFIDPMTFLDMFTSTSTQNDTGWKNKQYDAKITIAKQSSDPAIRMKAMHDAEAILMKDMPIIPIYFYTKPYAVKPNISSVYTPADEYPVLIYANIM